MWTLVGRVQYRVGGKGQDGVVWFFELRGVLNLGFH